MKRTNKHAAIWSVIAAMLFLTSALPSAYGLEFPMTTSIAIEPDSDPLTAQEPPLESASALYGSVELASTPVGSMVSSDMALVSSISRHVEIARTLFNRQRVP